MEAWLAFHTSRRWNASNLPCSTAAEHNQIRLKLRKQRRPALSQWRLRYHQSLAPLVNTNLLSLAATNVLFPPYDLSLPLPDDSPQSDSQPLPQPRIEKHRCCREKAAAEAISRPPGFPGSEKDDLTYKRARKENAMWLPVYWVPSTSCFTFGFCALSGPSGFCVDLV